MLTLLSCVTTRGYGNFGNAFVLLVQWGNGGGAMLKPSTLGTCVYATQGAQGLERKDVCACGEDLPNANDDP